MAALLLLAWQQLFFGPVSGAIAAILALFYRYFVVGGSGVLTGLLVIVSAFLIGWAFF